MREVKVDVKTPDGKKMTARAANSPIGTAMRIAPGFVATAVDEDACIETTIEAEYVPELGRYLLMTLVNRALDRGYDDERMRHVSTQGIIQAAVPHCIALRLDDTADAKWITIADLTEGDARILPEWLVDTVTKRGVKDERWDAIEILYGAAALSNTPPVKLISLELGIPERTASDWIKKSRAAGRLVGMTSNVGRPANG